MYAPIGFGATSTFSISTTTVPAGQTQSLQGAINFTQPFNLALNQGIYQIEVASQYAPGGQNGGGTVEPFNASAATISGALSIELYATVTTTFNFYVADSQNHVPPSGPWTHETMYTTPITIPAGVWTDVILPLNSNPGNWDSNFSTVDWDSITEVFIDAQGPPCAAAIPGGGYADTINYGPIEFVQTPAGPTPTPVNTPNWPCATNTTTATPTITSTPTATGTPTITGTSTFTFVATNTPTVTLSPTITLSPTPTATFPPDLFLVSQNLFKPSAGPLTITVQYPYAGHFSLRVYNTAGEHIRTLIDGNLSFPQTTVTWDGHNKYGDPCASGVYILYLIEPYERKLAKVILVK